MANPTITFRLNKYQLIRGLWLLRQQEANYVPSSASDIVKTLYLDVLAKSLINRPDPATEELVEEIQSLFSPRKKKENNFEAFFKDQLHQEVAQPKEEQSVIKTVSDFSPPTDWLSLDDDPATDD